MKKTGECSEKSFSLTAFVKSMSHSDREDNDFDIQRYGLEEVETGTWWFDYQIEAEVALTSKKSNRGYRLKQLILSSRAYPRSQKEYAEIERRTYERQVGALTPGNLVVLTIQKAGIKTYEGLIDVKKAEKLEISASSVQIVNAQNFIKMRR